ncbi:hypothetical protein MHC_02250 [Mycoplasma haemocanis str. Illinois]|uniref:Uncharacterized protein n=1 Tax=Mycoplasma haemocanis (strain Illinois) TaxID=1111676 RepID=H6N6P4_MYCHN|nr:hypothetical protein [Mycoplasma haemocanis]AEW45316.1 hypothetical protein MHC_02250 [Mycoplasma haemocanis str. Illinois]
MAKIVLVGSILAIGTGLGGIGLVVSESGGSRNNTVLKSQRIFSLPKRCDVYSVVSTIGSAPKAKWENPSFKDNVRHDYKQKVQDACDSKGKVYIANQGGLIYREEDQSRQWVLE